MSQGYQQSSSSTTKGENSESIPNDLILEILSRLPAKSIVRFRCVSKLWGSMLRRPHFTKLFLTMSSARPRILFGVQGHGEWLFYSSPHPQNPYEKSLVVAAKFHTKFHGQLYQEEIWSYASGLIYFPDFVIPKEGECKLPMICNPITGQYAILPKLISYSKSTSFLGFDPIGKQFKVLAEAYQFCSERDHHKILTLGTGNLKWRKNFLCPAYNHDVSDGICINGVLYYLGRTFREPYRVIVCFDVRSEKFKFIEAEPFCGRYHIKLIDYKGKLGGISREYDDADAIELCMWVLEDVEKQKWSKYVYTLPENEVLDICYFSVVGTTATGEIVLSMNGANKPFYVFYFNPERKTLQRVEIQGFENGGRVYAFVDHVEDLNAYDAKQLKSRPVNQGLRNITKRPKPQHRNTSHDLCSSTPSVKNKQPKVLLQNKFDLLANLE